MSLNDPQPLPQAGVGRKTWELVVDDMRERDEIGASKYGVRHQHDNGRDHLVDAYQEALDLCCYLRAEIERRRASAPRFGCQHGRPVGQPCPHCLGIGAKLPPQVRTFPIMAIRHGARSHRDDFTIPWELLAPHEQQARRNHQQTLEELAMRGGLSATEALAVIEDRPFAFGLGDPEDDSAEWKLRGLEVPK